MKSKKIGEDEEKSFEKKVQSKCKDKGICELMMYGPGVEKVFDEVKEIFPNKKTRIFSSDYLINKKKGHNIIEKIENNEIDIIIGTQLISKGFNFKNLNCIIVVDSDFSGKGYDLRSTEKNIQLFNQLSGRAGRYSSDSIIVYQTLTPNNFLFTESMINNPETFLSIFLIFFISLVISALASFLPAMKIAKMSTFRALRYE